MAEDSIELRQYPDPVARVSYPPLPRRGGNPNAVASDAVLGGVLARLSSDQSRAGVPQTPIEAPVVTPPLPDDPEVQAMRAAG